MYKTKIIMKEQSGYRYLFKNIGLLTLSSFATKLISFFLVPLYTNILTTSEYGTNDLFIATVGVLIPILTLNIQEAVLRFSLDKNIGREAIVSISIKYFVISNAIVAIGLVINQIFQFSSTIANYSIFFFLIFFVQALSGIITCYIRGIDKVADLSISSVITSIVTIACNILFLVVLKWGLIGYMTANIIGPAVQCLYLIVRSRFVNDIKLQKFDSEEKEMIAYSKPLIVNSIAWWINNVSDRYVIVSFCGLAENGIYSIAGKIPSILNIFQTIFNQAWTLSAVKDYDPDDRNGFFANTYAAYNCLMTIVCSFIILSDKLLANALYAKDFYRAWIYVPWLTIAILFGALSGYLGGFFSATKDSKVFARSTMVGAVCNLILNFTLTPIIGAMGAAIATVISFALVWAIRLIHSRKYINMKIRIIRDCMVYLLLIIQSIILLVLEGAALYFLEIGIFGVIVAMNWQEIISVVAKFSNITHNRLNRED